MTTRNTLGALLAALTLTFLAACGGTGSTGHEGTSSTTAPTQHNDADVAFAQQMIPHHRQAVEMADLVQGRTTTPQVVDLATRIKGAQDPEINTMTTWLQSWGAPTDEHGMDHGSRPMSGMMTDDQMTTLRAATGAAFDKQWLTLMTAHHEGAIDMAKTELKDGQNPDAKALARTITTTQQSEIDEMRALSQR
ncbi:DUF305 domain-containing protein [Actinokineospora bangkokensis]|uniref:DUF305 domain-containing protein n=1 Tax=Actinokineospora bangkokensis TaxID=1193682 RepID=A0A1Q9LSS3_9PSEU|nr:DUF305 domain-containing protein [Actinokineospora bangkokensis]OLR95059.1 DUF305 domain-containing protein [Actinokineospora bangkokensis]